MIRPARAIDTPRIVELLVEQHAQSRLADVTEVDEVYARRMTAQMIQRHGGSHDGATVVFVVEVDGQIEGVVIGALDRVYEIGVHLAAWDKFLVCTDKAPARAFLMLLKAFWRWADENPKVVEIGGSWSDIVATGERMDGVFTHEGFTRCGAIYRRTRQCSAEQRIAA